MEVIKRLRYQKSRKDWIFLKNNIKGSIKLSNIFTIGVIKSIILVLKEYRKKWRRDRKEKIILKCKKNNINDIFLYLISQNNIN